MASRRLGQVLVISPRGAGREPGERPGNDDVERLEALARMGRWTFDAETGTLSCSAHGRRLFGFAEHETPEDPGPLLSRIAPDHRRALLSAVAACQTEGTPFAVGCPLTRSGGDTAWVLVRGEPESGTGATARIRGVVQDLSELGGLELTGRFSRLRDALTGLPNRAWLHESAGSILSRATRHRWTTAILMVGIDRMHEVNTTAGYAAGDEVLVEVAHRLERAFRPHDVVARATPGIDTVSRSGADTFVIVCEDVDDITTVQSLCRRVSGLLDRPIPVADRAVEITASVGAVLVAPGATRLDEHLLAAETAMRSAKDAGGDGYEILPSGSSPGERSRRETVELQRALDDGELRLVYQPKVALDGRGIVGVEALLRWQHPERGLVSPREFIPLAESTGFIRPIGAWALAEACRQAGRWRRQQAAVGTFTVSVNVSAVQLRPELVDTVRAALANAHVPASSLRIELTESVLMDDVDVAMPVLRDLADLGVSLSVDDFGTGHSSLAYLKRLPLDELKIDRSFIEGLGADADSTAIVAAVVAMGHALGLSVVAEGVETAEQLHHLEKLGCDEAQGFFVGRPASASMMHDRLVEPTRTGLRRPAPAAENGDRILVVDDAADVRQLARVSLAASGFDVHEAESGREAMALAVRLRPACVLLDVEMPEVSGIEVCRELRSHPDTVDCTVVMLTSRADAAAKSEAFAIGADDYIVKPFSPRELVSRVRAAIRRRDRQTGSAGDGDTP